MKNIITLNKNKGFGAGGANTNRVGLSFEVKTDNRPRLLAQGFQPGLFQSLQKNNTQDMITFVSQHQFRQWMQNRFSVSLFRNPDEAYIIENPKNTKTIVKILEKKAQTVEGSVETKLWAGTGFKREYEIMLGPSFEVHYAFCVSTFLETRFQTSERFKILKQILDEQNIQILFGDQDNYFSQLDDWILM